MTTAPARLAAAVHRKPTDLEWGVLLTRADAVALDRMVHVSGCFVAPDANDDEWIWRENGDYPLPLVARRHFGTAPDLWDALVALIGGGE